MGIRLLGRFRHHVCHATHVWAAFFAAYGLPAFAGSRAARSLGRGEGGIHSGSKAVGFRSRRTAQRQAGLALSAALIESETRWRAISATLGRQAPSAVPKPDSPESQFGTYDYTQRSTTTIDGPKMDAGCPSYRSEPTEPTFDSIDSSIRSLSWLKRRSDGR
jgi:hypothetical protein